MQFSLRPYGTADEAAALELWRDTWQRAYPDIDFAARLPWWTARWRDELVPNAAVVVAEADGAMAGFVTLDGSGYLDQIVVGSAFQGTPVAQLLLDEAKRRSAAGVTLKVNADNARAIRFYRRNGFVVTGEETNPASGRAVLAMAWRP